MKLKTRRKKSSASNRRKEYSVDQIKIHHGCKQDEVKTEDLRGMKQWVQSLTYESLIGALGFAFHVDGVNSRKHRRQRRGESGSREFDLLTEMSSIQFLDQNKQKLSEIDTSKGWRRPNGFKFDTPCLFRWEKEDSGKQHEIAEPKSHNINVMPEPHREDPVTSRAIGGTCMPSELLDALAKAGVRRSTSALLETFNAVDEDNEFEQSTDDQNITTKLHLESLPFSTNFHVEADWGIADDGTSLGKGTTLEQQKADRLMMLCTALNRDNAPDNKSKSLLPRCMLIISGEAADNELQGKELILDTLHMASRGKFLSKAPNRRSLYLAPWFDPTLQWFTLPMYLASRFEASLWDAYFQRSEMEQPSNESKKNSVLCSLKNLDRDAIERVLCYALGYAIKEDFTKKENNESSPLESIRKTLLWKLLVWHDSTDVSLKKQKLPSFPVSSLLEWGTPPGELKSLVMDYLQEGLVCEAERSLMQTMPATKSKNSKAKKKKKKRQKKRGQNSSKLPTAKTDEVQSNGDNSSDDEPHVECILPNTPSENLADYCHDASLDHSHQAKMTALKIIDEVLSNVFDRLGVQCVDFSDFTDAVTVKSRRESLQRQFRSPSVDKTLSADEIEATKTALVSNKAGTNNGAMRLLRRTDHDRKLSSSPADSQNSTISRGTSHSRFRRQTLDWHFGSNDASHLKRSKSSGDGSMLEKKSPEHTTDGYQPTPSRPVCDAALWPSSDSPLIPQASQTETSIFDGAPLCLSGALDSWNSVASQKQNETSIFTDLFNQESVDLDRKQANFASSTAASIASSRGDIGDAGLNAYDDCVDSPLYPCDALLVTDENAALHIMDTKEQGTGNVVSSDGLSRGPATSTSTETFLPNRICTPVANVLSDSPDSLELSPTLSSPPTPPPQLSPILVSLADLGKLRKEVASGEFKKKNELLSNPLSFNSIPKAPARPRTLTPSLSRDDLRSIDECRKPPRRNRDDHHTMHHRQIDALLSYRNVVVQSVPRKPPSLKSYDGIHKHRDEAHPSLTRSTRSTKTSRSGSIWLPGRDFPNLSASVSPIPLHKEPILNKVINVACARSEGGLVSVEDVSHCNVIRAQTDDMTKDGATTISDHSPPETEHLTTLKEERNSYRDMCLTLGAENAKLRNLLASKTCAPIYHPSLFTQDAMSPFSYQNDQHMWPTQHSTFPNQLLTHSIVAMSDAGNHRGDCDCESQNSVYDTVIAKGDSVQSFGRRTSGGGTCAESDTSLDHNVGGQEFCLHRINHQDSCFGLTPLHGIESRLSKDVSRYMKALASQLKKNEPRRLWAVEGMTKIVKALWPRAQIKIYGSHVTKLCLPSSDMDFVICLPAVHKNAPATAPGDLEGRNAIIETNQKVLARRLKSEAWLDQRSIKVIERTAVPVIKVSTKGPRSRVVQLDLSFDAKEHHGLEALNMIGHILEQLPIVRPLVLVLKQFLLDRGLLTAYTGGLSSYCLFLMVSRYCQEQAPTWNDVGSLLMGLLDFYGNFFDPRTTGISVRTRQYFFRSQDEYHSQQQFSDVVNRNNFPSKPHRFQSLNRQSSFQNTKTNTSQQFKSGKFDPIWVEDPLNPGNNVGRNAFRIFQVQRAFSDAHRALVASLEWDINSMHEFGDDSEYPLLKCLLQNEDVFFPIDEPIRKRGPIH